MVSSSLDGKVAFVTGADRNLGKAMATALLRDGANVVATAMYGSLLSQFVEECGAADRVLTLEGDISRDDDRQRLMCRNRALGGFRQKITHLLGAVPHRLHHRSGHLLLRRAGPQKESHSDSGAAGRPNKAHVSCLLHSHASAILLSRQ